MKMMDRSPECCDLVFGDLGINICIEADRDPNHLAKMSSCFSSSATSWSAGSTEAPVYLIGEEGRSRGT